MSSVPISNKRRMLEISAVIITAAGKFIFMDWLNWRFAFVAIAISAWVIYIIYHSKKQPGILTYWGFRTDNFWKTAKLILPFGLFSLVIFFGIGFYRGTINMTWHLIPILILYPIWGTIQQFLLIALTAGNMHDMKNQTLSKGLIILIAAILFALVHFPDTWLIIGTFILALLYGVIYLKERNIYVLGIFHGWLGGIFYYTVVDRDPFLEMYGKLLNLKT
jgi:membrane protease YdiL (CAAX protease family)